MVLQCRRVRWHAFQEGHIGGWCRPRSKLAPVEACHVKEQSDAIALLIQKFSRSSLWKSQFKRPSKPAQRATYLRTQAFKGLDDRDASSRWQDPGLVNCRSVTGGESIPKLNQRKWF